MTVIIPSDLTRIELECLFNNIKSTHRFVFLLKQSKYMTIISLRTKCSKAEFVKKPEGEPKNFDLRTRFGTTNNLPKVLKEVYTLHVDPLK